MDFGGSYVVEANRLAVWTALNDASVLKAAIPGCRRIEWVGPVTLVAEIGVDLGVATPVLAGELMLSDVVPAERYTLTGQGKGGIFGKARASADVVLADHAGGTLLVFTASGGASGRLLSIGRKILGRSAQAVIDGFFLRFGEAMEARVVPLPPPQ